VSETAMLLGISRALAYRLVKNGRIRHIRFGRRIVVPYSAIQELVDGTLAPQNNSAPET
jgi:excisionase family DNA binding protein